MLDKLADSLGSIFPPNTDTGPAVRRWRVMVSLWVIFFCVHIAWACSWLPGVTGFAMASDVGKLQSAVQTIIVSQVRGSLFEVRVQQCEALKAGRPTTVYAEKLQDLLADYEDLTGDLYPLPACVDL